MGLRNRLGNCHNPFQGNSKRVLCVCSAGLLRSPTTAKVLAQEYGYNTRSCGISEEYALILIDEVLVEWADEIVVMEKHMADYIDKKFSPDKPIVTLSITDNYDYNSPALVARIKTQYDKYIEEWE